MTGMLEERLDRIRQGAAKRIPAEALEVMHRATTELEDSGQAERAVGTGDTAPRFALPDSQGRETSLSGLLQQGPLVLTFFRGHW